MLLSPLRPQTTMAIEKLKMAAREAQPRVISIGETAWCGRMLPRLQSPTPPVAMSVIRSLAAVRAAIDAPAPVQEKSRLRQPYPNLRVIVLDDDVNTFQHVAGALVRHIPAMQPDQAWQLAVRIDGEGSAVVWCGPLEQAELYHQLLAGEGLTMAPLERD
jgi:ATP-dependent Clp protease adaptor protein ClpS